MDEVLKIALAEPLAGALPAAPSRVEADTATVRIDATGGRCD